MILTKRFLARDYCMISSSVIDGLAFPASARPARAQMVNETYFVKLGNAR